MTNFGDPLFIHLPDMNTFSAAVCKKSALVPSLQQCLMRMLLAICVPLAFLMTIQWTENERPSEAWHYFWQSVSSLSRCTGLQSAFVFLFHRSLF